MFVNEMPQMHTNLVRQEVDDTLKLGPFGPGRIDTLAGVCLVCRQLGSPGKASCHLAVGL